MEHAEHQSPLPQGPGSPSSQEGPHGAGDAGKIISAIHGGMIALMQVMSSTRGISVEDKSRLGGIIQEFQRFVRENLMGEEPIEQRKGPRPIPAQAVAEGVVPEAAGNRRVSPAL